MSDFFTSLFSRFTSENTSYGSPQQIEPEPTEEKDSAAEPNSALNWTLHQPASATRPFKARKQ